MSSVPPSVVYTGYWIDHSYSSQVLGATITLRSSAANFLIAFLAFLVSVAGLQCWELVAFFHYFARVKTKSGGLYHQQQVLIRNVSTPGALTTRLMKLAWSWRAVDKSAWYKCIVTISLALSVSIGFIVSGIFSSKIVRSTNIDILVDSADCGWRYTSGEFETDSATALYRYQNEVFQTSTQYSKTCYNSTGTFNPACSIFVTSQLPITNVSHASCPFADDMCPYAPAIYMDTGLLDSHDHFGINGKESDRLQVRRITSCAPLKTETFFQTDDARDDLELMESGYGRDPYPGEMLYKWNYGSFLVNGKPRDNTTLTKIWASYESSTTRSYYVSNVAFYGHGDSQLSDSSFYPIPELFAANPDSEISVLLIHANRVAYVHQVDDPVFAAHEPFSTLRSSGQVPYFSADKPAGVIGCIEQQQFCNPTNNQCTSLNNSAAAESEGANINLNPRQNATLALLDFNMVDMAYLSQVAGLIVAKEASSSDIQEQLMPTNQWELEVKAWKQAALAATQRLVADYAIGIAVSSPKSGEGQYTVRPASQDEQFLCSQKMKAPNGFSNVSVFGLGFTVGICGLVILLNQLLPRLVLMFLRRKQLLTTQVSSWYQDSVLQLQRVAFENGGVGQWAQIDRDVPITLEKEELEAISSTQALKRASTSKTNELTSRSSDSNIGISPV